jgi:hypothetical protein
LNSEEANCTIKVDEKWGVGVDIFVGDILGVAKNNDTKDF